MIRIGWLIIMFGIFSIPAFISSVHADIVDMFSKFHPFISLQEDYSDNINLTATNRKGDFITTVAPGVRFSTAAIPISLMPGQFVPAAIRPGMMISPGQFPQPPPSADPWGVDLNYFLGLVSYAQNSQFNYVSHTGTLNSWYSFDRNFSLRLRDYFVRSEDPREREFSAGAPGDQFLIGVQRERAVYSRNVLEPTVEYRFGREDLVTLYYRNNIYQTESTSAQNSQEHYFNPRFVYWFDIRNGITLEYGLTRGDFQASPDLWGQMSRARYTYRFNPNTSVFGDYIFIRRDFQAPGVDYNVHNPSIGISHAFSPTLTGSVQSGYYSQIPERGSSNGGLTYDLGLTKIIERTALAFFFQGGYREDYFSSQNSGFTRYYRSIARISHPFTARTNSSFSGSWEVIEFSSGQKDNVWRIFGNCSYLALKWLALSLTLSYLEDSSTNSAAEYRETRATLWIIVNP
jgi:hypothetical protein